MEKINNGMVIVNLELSDETIDYLNQYKTKNNLTFEEYIESFIPGKIYYYNEYFCAYKKELL